jgi:peptidoglycan/LPS O-acetylase OafA/YrhL
MEQQLPNPVQVHYRYLDGLRGLAAAYVAFYHLLAWVPASLPRWITRLQKPISFGHVAVSIFIVLSGYSLMLPVVRSQNNELRGGWIGYMKRRARRILPAYYGAVLLAVAVWVSIARSTPSLAAQELAFGSIATHLLLIHNWFFQYNHTINDAHWSVAAEWQIYFLFPFLFLPIWRRFGKIALLVTAFAVALLPLMLLPRSLNLSWTCPWYVALFAVGNVAAITEVRQLKLTARFGLVFGSFGLAALYLLVHTVELRHGGAFQDSATPMEFMKDSIAGFMVAAFLIYCTSSLHGSWPKPLVAVMLESRLPVALGAVSYSLYLTHFSILNLCVTIADRMQLSDLTSFWLRLFVGLPVAFVVAWLFYLTLERPFLTRRKGERSSSAPLAQVTRKIA